jgi:hypothetical protein
MNAQPVDHDLLARYVGGALDDSPDGADVAELVANDPAWADAHDRLVVALEAVGADLAAYAAVDEPMPDDVAARLDAALADAPPAPPGLTVVPGGRSAGAGAGGARHQRRKKIPGWLAPVAVAAGVVAFAGFWLNSAGGGFSGDDSGGSDSAATSSDAGGNAEQAPAAAGPIPRREATGQNYDEDRVEAGPGYRTLLSPPPEASSVPGAGKDPDSTFEAGAAAAAPAELSRLTVPAELAACLDSIAAEHGVPITTTTTVDYARYEGKPALMVFFVDASGQEWAWVAGPDCGPGGPDTRYSTRVT